MQQIAFIEPAAPVRRTSSLLKVSQVGVTSELLDILRRGKDVVIAHSLSGGKDCRAMALTVDSFLNDIGFKGERVCIHADLDDEDYQIEWREARQSCQEIADYLGHKLLVVRRKNGGMITRWLQRWHANVDRYINLKCVKLILPWSTAGMRFCTGEQKVAPIALELTKRYPGKIIISVVGIRAEESDTRAGKALLEESDLLTKKTRQTTGYTWNAIRDMTIADVRAVHVQHGLTFPKVYTDYNLSRLSCSFCVLSALSDLIAAAATEEAVPAYRALTRLEVDSTFSFQSSRWLADIAPHLLDADVAARRTDAKHNAKKREEIESVVPEHLLFTKHGWPKCVPTYAEAVVLADVRQQIGELMDFPMRYITPSAIITRYTELYDEREARDTKVAKAKARREAREAAGDPTVQTTAALQPKQEKYPSRAQPTFTQTSLF